MSRSGFTIPLRHVALVSLLLLTLAAAGSRAAAAADPGEYRKRPAGEWEVLFEEGISLEEYARQLDYFGIELGVATKAGQIQYASHLSDKKPQRRLGSEELEKRLCVRWKRGTLAVVDRKLLAAAGINSQDRELLHFYPDSISADLARLEQTFQNHPPEIILRTRFRIRPKPLGEAGYDFWVAEQAVKNEKLKAES